MNKTNNKDSATDVVFDIQEHIGVIAAYPTGWSKELNIVAWNGNEPKYDLRDWDPVHEHMSRGITLRKEEAEKLAGMLQEHLREPGRQKQKNKDGNPQR